MTTEAKVIITVLSIVTIFAILFGVCIHMFGKFRFLGNASGNRDVEGSIEIDDEFTDISFEGNFADLTIRRGDSFSIDYNVPESLVPTTKVDGGTLKIVSKGKGFSSVGGFHDYHITITIPEGMDLDELSIDLDAGDIKIKNFTGSNLIIDVDAGNVELEDMNYTRINIDADAGNIELDSCTTDDLTVDVDAGNLEIRDSVIDTIEADADAGNIESHNCTINRGHCDVDLGNISLNGNIGDVKIKASLGNATIN